MNALTDMNELLQKKNKGLGLSPNFFLNTDCS